MPKKKSNEKKRKVKKRRQDETRENETRGNEISPTPGMDLLRKIENGKRGHKDFGFRLYKK